MSGESSGLLTTLEQKASPDNAALLVIDVQNDFVASEGFFGKIGADVEAIQHKVIPALQRLIAAARERGVPVVFVQAIYDDCYLSDAMRERNLRRNVTMERCISGSWGAEFYGVEPAPGESVVVKHRYSAAPFTGLLESLSRRGVNSLLLAGVATDTCVDSTGRDAYFADFYVTMVADCCGAFSREDHDDAVKRFDRDYGAVVNSTDLIACWGGGQAGATAKSLVAGGR